MLLHRMRRAVAVAMLGALVVLAGCRGFSDPITSGKTPHQQQRGVTMLSRAVRDSFILDAEPVATRAPDGQMQIRFNLRNRFESGDLFADVQFQFFDATGHVVEKSEWRTMEFPARELVLVEGSSIRADTKSFNVQFKNLTAKFGRVPVEFGFVFERGVWLPSVSN